VVRGFEGAGAVYGVGVGWKGQQDLALPEDLLETFVLRDGLFSDLF
jgi:hypothetical protein